MTALQRSEMSGRSLGELAGFLDRHLPLQYGITCSQLTFEIVLCIIVGTFETSKFGLKSRMCPIGDEKSAPRSQAAAPLESVHSLYTERLYAKRIAWSKSPDTIVSIIL